MSAPPITEPREERGAFFRLGQLGYRLSQAEAAAGEHKARNLEAERLVEAVADTLGLDLPTLQRIGQAQPEYFRDTREKILEALADWEDDQKIPVCLHCGSPRVDWFETVSDCGWRCQDCGSVEDAVAQGRKATRSQHPAQNKFCSERQTKGVNQ